MINASQIHIRKTQCAVIKLLFVMWVLTLLQILIDSQPMFIRPETSSSFLICSQLLATLINIVILLFSSLRMMPFGAEYFMPLRVCACVCNGTYMTISSTICRLRILFLDWHTSFKTHFLFIRLLTKTCSPSFILKQEPKPKYMLKMKCVWREGDCASVRAWHFKSFSSCFSWWWLYIPLRNKMWVMGKINHD